MLPFWISIALLSLAQGAVVAVPAAAPRRWLERARGRRLWAAVPALSVIAFVLIAGAAEQTSAQVLTYLALCAVPVLAALALGWLSRGARPRHALAVAPLFVLAWVDRGGLAGEGAALVLSALSCAALGSLLAALTPPRWLAAGIVAMALADSALVISDLLQRPNSALNAAHPAAGLPRLQDAVLGSAVMGYGDLFIAGVLGALLATTVGPRSQRHGAMLTAAVALAFDLLFLLVSELPATVPVALALLVLAFRRRPRSARSRAAPAPHAASRAGRPRRARAAP
jgi:NADH:ubiquinone oxidoreductase subunit K